MLENLLAAELLEVRILHPPCAQLLVRQGMHVFEDEQTRHQTDRQRRLARAARVNLAQAAGRGSPQSIFPASRTSGWPMSMIRSSTGRNRSGCRSSRGRAIPTPIPESMTESNQKRVKTGITNRKNTASAPALSCKNLYLPR